MEALKVGQRVEFHGKVHTIVKITRPLGNYEIYHLTRQNTTRQAFRYQLDPNFQFDSDEDEMLGTINLDDLIPDDAPLASPNPNTMDVASGSGTRFVHVSESELDRVELQKNEKNTDKMTDWGVKVFQDWLGCSGLSPDFEHLHEDELNERLRRFYVEARTRKGEVYSKSALVGIRAGINRHINSPPFSSTVNIMKDRPFMSSNNVLVGVIKEHRREGRDVTVHKEPISTGDLQKLYHSDTLSISNPTSLIRKVWFDVEYHFGRRGREGLRHLRVDSFVFEKDDTNTEYVRMAYNESDKNHHGIDTREREKNVRMYASGDEKCPVQSLRLYLSKRNKDNDHFFQRPLKNPSSGADCWYYNRPMGARKLGEMMSDISQDAGLSRWYTNHCLRATSATVLSHAGVGIQGIMSVTGHRNESSVRSYVQQPSVEQRRSFSRILHSAVLGGPSDFGNNQSVVSATHTEQTCFVQSSSRSSALPALFHNANKWRELQHHLQLGT